MAFVKIETSVGEVEVDVGKPGEVSIWLGQLNYCWKVRETDLIQLIATLEAPGQHIFSRDTGDAVFSDSILVQNEDQQVIIDVASRHRRIMAHLTSDGRVTLHKLLRSASE